MARWLPDACRMSGLAWVRAFATLIVVAAGEARWRRQVVVIVNGEPITALDIEQRTQVSVCDDVKSTRRARRC